VRRVKRMWEEAEAALAVRAAVSERAKKAKEAAKKRVFEVKDALKRRGVILGASLYPSILPMQQVDVSLEHMPSDRGGGGGGGGVKGGDESFLGYTGQGAGVGGGAVKWPLLFIYQEHQQTDFLRQCAEDSTIDDHLQSVLDPALAPPPWDSHRTLSPSSVSVYYISYQTPVWKDGRWRWLQESTGRVLDKKWVQVDPKCIHSQKSST